MRKSLLLGFVSLFILFNLSSNVEAYRVEKKGDIPVKDDFPIGPTQFDIVAERGDVITKQIQIDNRKGEQRKFFLEIEDFEGSLESPKENVILQGDGSGRYGAKDWFDLEMNDFEIEHGDRLFMDVTITIPEDADAGDHYASVLVSVPPKDDEMVKMEGQNVRITSRAGVLFFIRVKGDIKEEGKTRSFETDRKWYEKDPVIFRTTFENTGSVRLRPYGKIEVKNMLGTSISSIDVEPFNVLRDSARSMTHTFENDRFLIGKYTAVLKLNRGYGGIIDETIVSFWVIPWKIILAAVVAIITIYAILRFIRNKFQFEVKIKKK